MTTVFYLSNNYFDEIVFYHKIIRTKLFKNKSNSDRLL